MTKKLQPLLLSIIIKFLAVGAGLYVSRFLNNPNFVDPKLLRDYNLIIVYVSFLMSLLSFGIQNLIYKFYINEKDSRNYANFWTTILTLQGFLFLIGLIITLIIFPFTGFANLFLFLGIFLIHYVLIIDSNFRSICDAFGHNWQFSLSDLFIKILLIFALYSATFFPVGDHFKFFLAVSVILYIFGFFLDWFLQKEYTSLGKVDLNIIKDNRNFFLYISITAFISAIYTFSDKLFLDWNGFDEFVINGYSNAFKLNEIAVLIPVLTAPVLASFTKKELDNQFESESFIKLKIFLKNKLNLNLQNKWYISLKWLIVNSIIGFGATVGTLIFGNFALLLTDPQKIYYKYSSESLFWLSFVFVFASLSIYFYNVFVLFNKEKQGLWIIVLVGIFTLSAYSFLIPVYGHIGAAMATLASVVFDSILKAFVFIKIIAKLEEKN